MNEDDLQTEEGDEEEPTSEQVTKRKEEREKRLRGFYERWRLDGDLLRCRGCRGAGISRAMLPSRAGVAFDHKPDCTNSTSVAPWGELSQIIAGVA